MFAKIAAGVLAAVAVTGVGVYVAMPETHCNGGCPLSRMQSAPVVEASETPSCCSMPVACTVPAPQNESLGACTGAATLVSTSKAPAHTCCTDE